MNVFVQIMLCWSVCAGSQIYSAHILISFNSLENCALLRVKHHKKLSYSDVIITCWIVFVFLLFKALKHLVTDPHRGAYTCASYITVSLDEMEKMSGSISRSVLHQCATLKECEGELNLANLMLHNPGKTEEKCSERAVCGRGRGGWVGKYDEGKLKVSLVIFGQSSQRDFSSARSSQLYIQVICKSFNALRLLHANTFHTIT